MGQKRKHDAASTSAQGTESEQAASSPACCEATCALKLKLRGGRTLSACRCALAAASPVLRQALSLPLATPGVLPLLDDDQDTWKTVLHIIRPETYPMALVNWGNVEPLLRLADKYDMAVVRGYGAHFLSFKTLEMRLGEPLDSPKNTLRAASLVDSLASKPELLPYRSGVLAALQSQLWPITTASLPKPKASPAKHSTGFDANDFEAKQLQEVRGHLERWLADARYKTLVTADVQVLVAQALLKGVPSPAAAGGSGC